MDKKNIAKHLLLSSSLLAMLAMAAPGRAQTAAPAQEPTQATPMHEHGKMHDELAGLNLTDDQKAQIKEIHEKAKTQAETVKADTTLSAEQKKEKLKELHKDTHEQVMKLLTPEQRKQLKEERKEHHQEAKPQTTPQQ